MFSSNNRVEKRVVRMYWNDGLLDLLAGCGAILIGVAWLCHLVPLGATVPALMLPFWRPLRARITEPRLGYVEFSDRQERRHGAFLTTTIALGASVLLVVTTLGVLVARGTGVDRPMLTAALPACLLGMLALLTATVIGQVRFAFYAAALVLGGVVVAWLDWEPGWSILAGGLVVLVGGIRTMAQFLSRYPLNVDAKALK